MIKLTQKAVKGLLIDLLIVKTISLKISMLGKKSLIKFFFVLFENIKETRELKLI